MQKRLNRSIWRLVFGLGWAEGSKSSIWRIRLNRPSTAAMRPYVKLLLTTCSFCKPLQALTLRKYLPAKCKLCSSRIGLSRSFRRRGDVVHTTLGLGLLQALLFTHYFSRHFHSRFFQPCSLVSTDPFLRFTLPANSASPCVPLFILFTGIYTIKPTLSFLLARCHHRLAHLPLDLR